MPRVFFWFLTFFAAFCVAMGYAGIQRLHNTQNPPFEEPGVMHTRIDIVGVSEGLVREMDSWPGQIAVWLLVFGVPIGCGRLAFKHGRLLSGLSLMLLWAAVSGYVGLRIYLHGLFVPG